MSEDIGVEPVRAVDHDVDGTVGVRRDDPAAGHADGPVQPAGERDEQVHPRPSSRHGQPVGERVGEAVAVVDPGGGGSSRSTGAWKA